MFVVPPPPRYPTNTPYNPTGAPVSTAVPLIEIANTLSHPTGPDHQLLAGEGTYVLRDDLHLSTPPPHPSEAPVSLVNPLATAVGPPTAGTRLSFVKLGGEGGSTKKKGGLYKVTSSGSTGNNRIGALQNLSLKEDPREGQQRSSGEESHTSDEAKTSSSTDGKMAGVGEVYNHPAPAFGEGNTSLTSTTSNSSSTAAAAPTGKDAASKRKKPKSNVVKSNSAFISRVILHDRLTTRLQEREKEGGGWMAFANIGRSFHWLDLSEQPQGKKEQPLTKILMTKAHALCHDVNQVTKSPGHLDVIIGYSTGDIIWFEPFSQKYSRLNKNGVINASPVSEIKWIPGSESLFLAAHTDGSLVVYDKEKDDVLFVPEDSPATEEGQAAPTLQQMQRRKGSADSDTVLRVSKSVNSRNQKANPVACWKLSNQRINGFAFSPDCKHLAVVGEDGSLRIIDYLKEQLLDHYSSYYGGFTCVCWSPDGRYILTGGQDDLVSVWSLPESRIVARCHGHHSWVSAVAFDPWRCDERNYRFGSVGEDCRLLLWDFSEGMLHRPKTLSVRHRPSISSQIGGPVSPIPPRPSSRHQSSARLRSNSNITSSTSAGELDDGDAVRHPIEPRASTARLPPVLSKVIDPNPLCGLEFQEECIITSCEDGHIRTWDRPKEGGKGENESQETLQGKKVQGQGQGQQ